MKLLFHQFKKDFRQTWVVWALWLFFVLLQFGLALLSLPADFYNQLSYVHYVAPIIPLIPGIHALLLFVLVPSLVMLDPPVGTTAPWLTRPISPMTVLGSKLLSLAILVLFPMLGDCAILAAHHVVVRDILFAGIEIVLRESHAVAIAMALAVICPSFARFVITGVLLLAVSHFAEPFWPIVLSYCTAALPVSIQKAFTFSHDGPSFLSESQAVLDYLLCFAIGLSIIIFQYLTRRTRVSVGFFTLGILLFSLLPRIWTWDFLGQLAFSTPPPEPVYDASPLHLEPLIVNSSEETTSEGFKLQLTSMQYQSLHTYIESDLSLSSLGGELEFADGKKMKVNSSPFSASQASTYNGPLTLPFPNFYTRRLESTQVQDMKRKLEEQGITVQYQSTNTFQHQSFQSPTRSSGSLVIDAALGHLVLLNGSAVSPGAYDVGNLFSIDSDLLSGAADGPVKGNFKIKGSVSTYQIAAEIPLKIGAHFSNKSRRTTLTSITLDSGGVELALDERTMNLLLHPASDPDENTYILVNRNRSEAIIASVGNSSTQTDPSDVGPSFLDFNDHQFEVTNVLNLSCSAAVSYGGVSALLPVEIDQAWLNDATLVKLEPKSLGNFFKDLAIPFPSPKNFDYRFRNDPAPEDPTPTLPNQPTRPQIWDYIQRVLQFRTSDSSRTIRATDPEVDQLFELGSEHATELIIAECTLGGTYPLYALEKMDLRNNVEAKAMLKRILPEHQELVNLVKLNHWEADFRNILLDLVNSSANPAAISQDWLESLNALHNEADVKSAMLTLVPANSFMVQIVLENHWEADVKPILMRAVVNQQNNNLLSQGWEEILAAFNDDSQVKADLLRSLDQNPDYVLQTVEENGWEDDAAPILLDIITKAEPTKTYDRRFFSILSAYDNPAVKQAMFKTMIANPDALTVIAQNEWEAEAVPIIVNAINSAKPTDRLDDGLIRMLDQFGDKPGVKEAVLKVLPVSQEGAMTVINDNHWQNDAEPIIVNELLYATPAETFTPAFFRFLEDKGDHPK